MCGRGHLSGGARTTWTAFHEGHRVRAQVQTPLDLDLLGVAELLDELVGQFHVRVVHGHLESSEELPPDGRCRRGLYKASLGVDPLDDPLF